MASIVAGEPSVTLDYGAVVDAEHLSVPTVLDGRRPLRLIIAADVGPVRLIDNAPVEVALRAGRSPAGLVGAGTSGR
jgi:pantothenate synthetase